MRGRDLIERRGGGSSPGHDGAPAARGLGTRSMSQRAGEHGLLSRVEKSIDLPSDVSN